MDANEAAARVAAFIEWFVPTARTAGEDGAAWLVDAYLSGGPAFYVIVIGVLFFAVFTFAFVKWAAAQ